MIYLAWLVPIALGMGVVGLVAFMWSMRSGQYDDLDGAAERVLLADAADAPLDQRSSNGAAAKRDSSNNSNTYEARRVHQITQRSRL